VLLSCVVLCCKKNGLLHLEMGRTRFLKLVLATTCIGKVIFGKGVCISGQGQATGVIGRG